MNTLGQHDGVGRTGEGTGQERLLALGRRR